MKVSLKVQQAQPASSDLSINSCALSEDASPLFAFKPVLLRGSCALRQQ